MKDWEMLINSARVFICFIFFMMMSICHAQSDANPALVMVKTYGLGSNLEAITLQAASQTQTYQLSSTKIGKVQTQALVQKHIRQLLPNYQQRWDENLAASYAMFLKANEIDSITMYGESSPYFSKVTANRVGVSQAMQKKSQQLLTDFVSKTMQAVSAEK